MNIPQHIDDMVRGIDADYMGSDGVVNGQPAFQWDFKHNGQAMQVFFINKN